MRTIKSLLAAVMLAAVTALPAQSAPLVFDFYWTGDVAGSPDPTLRAVGTIAINKAAGTTFTRTDIASTSITVSRDGYTDWTFTSWSSAFGTIAADGLSASFGIDLGEEGIFGEAFINAGNSGFFGCNSLDCRDMYIRVRIGVTPDGGHGDYVDVFYASQAEALASMRMTRSPSAIPLPAGLPLLLGALGLLYAARRRAAGMAA